MFSAGYQADVDLDHGTTLNKKIRNAQLAQYNFIFGKTTYCVLLTRKMQCGDSNWYFLLRRKNLCFKWKKKKALVEWILLHWIQRRLRIQHPNGRKKGKWAQTTIIKHVALQFFIPASHSHFINKWNELTFDSKKILSGFQSWTAIKAIAKWQWE